MMSPLVEEIPEEPGPEIAIKFGKNNAFGSIARDSTNSQDIGRPRGGKQF